MISVVIPAFNEEGAIADTIQTVRAMCEGAGIEDLDLVVVDDGSTDKTGEEAAACGACVVRHPHNAGYGKSLKDGIAAARHDTIVITDADGTYPIEAVPSLLETYRRGFDMVVGARTGRVYEGSRLKSALRLLLRFLVEYTTGRKIPDINSGLRVFSRATIMPYFSHLGNSFSFTTSITLAYFMTGRYIAYVPVSYQNRIGSSKVHLFRDAMRTLQFIIEAILYYNPLKLFLLLSGLCLVAAVISLAVGVGFGLLGGLVLGTGFVLLSVLVFGLGLQAVLLKHIMDK